MRLFRFFAALLIPAFALACGGADEQSSPTSVPATQSAGAQATIPGPAASPAGTQPTAQPAATQAAGGQVGANSELTALVQNLTTVRNYRASLSIEAGPAGTQQGTLDVVQPDRYHLTLTGSPAGAVEIISIGSDLYLKLGPTWTKQAGGGGLAFFSPQQITDELNAATRAQQVTRGGTASVSGRNCQIYSWTNQGNAVEVCVADGLPLRVVTQAGAAKVTVVFSGFNATLDIRAPI